MSDKAAIDRKRDKTPMTKDDAGLHNHRTAAAISSRTPHAANRLLFQKFLHRRWINAVAHGRLDAAGANSIYPGCQGRQHQAPHSWLGRSHRAW